MRSYSVSTVGRVVTTLAVVAIAGLIFIALFFVVGGVFGPLNDICVGLEGVLSGRLAWMLYPANRAYAHRLSHVALGSSLVGALLTTVGSVLFHLTDWFLAGLVTTFGYAFIGLWLLATNASALRRGAFPRRLAYLGIVAGGVSASGLLAAPGIFGRVDAIHSAQWFLSASMYIGGFGWSILYTIWCFWLGRLLSSARVSLQAATAPRAA